MPAILRVADIRAVEAAWAAQLPAGTLMQRAGQAIADWLVAHIDGPLLFLAGPGNNGGDALVAATRLHRAFRQVWVVRLGTGAPSPDTLQALQDAQVAGVPLLDQWPTAVRPAAIVDGLFGIGLQRAMAAPYTQWVACAHAARVPIIALDVPSGIDADRGVIVGGPQAAAIHASVTLTFIADKPGLHMATGADCAGDVVIFDLGCTRDAVALEDPGLRTDPVAFAHLFAPRLRNTHKGSFGDVAIIGADAGTAGAGVLAARTALFSGAGRVLLHPLDASMALDWLHPEIMIRPLNAVDAEAVHVIGPGLGVSSRASDIVCDALAWASPLIIDADALNLIATSTTLQDSMRARAARGHATVMTPHPLEAARLLGQPLSDVTHDRLRAARTLAKTFNAIVVLKGVGSIICAPTGAWQMNITGNPGLASGGTGDVLAGLLGGLIAQHPQASILETVCGGVWLHGRAADHLVAQGIGPNGLTASELAPALRVLINRPSRAALPAS